MKENKADSQAWHSNTPVEHLKVNKALSIKHQNLTLFLHKTLLKLKKKKHNTEYVHNAIKHGNVTLNPLLPNNIL